MKARRIILINVIMFIVLAVLVVAGYYFYDQSVKYLSTDNAQVTGQEFVIAAPAAGKLTDWKASVGETFSSGQAVGTLTIPPAAGQKTPVSMDITSPADGTVVQTSAVTDEFVAPGTPLAYAFDMKHLWVSANIKETDVNDVKLGQTVDVYVDAYPGTSLQGTVNEIGLTTASTFSLLPQSNDSGNFTKVTQVIPVKITLNGYQGMSLVPGMSVTVRIHK